MILKDYVVNTCDVEGQALVAQNDLDLLKLEEPVCRSLVGVLCTSRSACARSWTLPKDMLGQYPVLTMRDPGPMTHQ